ncbi:streptophobe family protein [Streptomyces sp. NPDC056716]|uniref:streptophobe family protein n=1 Tax=unclassified Streptomyces TaxID=2593676 RepID=UPI0036BE2453
MDAEGVRHGRRVPWIDVVLSAIASVSWALIGMAGTAALGLHLLEADAAGSLGPMTAAVVALGAGGSVSPSGDMSAFGLEGAEATTAIEITPLGVSLVGALLLSWIFLRSLRAAGAVVSPAELLARVGAVVVLFVASLGGLAWAGHDVITIDGGALGLDDVPGAGGTGGIEIPGLGEVGDVGDIGDLGGLLPDRVGDLIDAKAAVGFTVDTVPTLLGGLGWVVGVLLIALLASRRTPLPRGLAFMHRVVRPAVSSLVTVLLVAVAAGLAAAAYAAIGDDHPKRIAGAALLGAPNGVWLGVPIGLFVPYEGDATGPLTRFLPDPLDDLLADSDGPVTLGRLAELDTRVWLLGVGAGVLMLLAGVVTAVRTPVGRGVAEQGVAARMPGGPGVRGWTAVGPTAGGSAPGGGRVREGGASGAVGDVGVLGFVMRCAVPLGVVMALALPLLGWLAEISVDASLSVLGVDAFGAGVELRARFGSALLLGAVWGVGAGAVGALLAYATGAAGRRAVRWGVALGDVGAGGLAAGAGTGVGAAEGAGAGPYGRGVPYRAPNPATNPYLRVPEEGLEGRVRGVRGPESRVRERGSGVEGAGPGVPGQGRGQGVRGQGPGASGGAGAAEPGPSRGVAHDDAYGSPTVPGPVVPPAPPSPRRPPTSPEEGPPPPPGRPKGRR